MAISRTPFIVVTSILGFLIAVLIGRSTTSTVSIPTATALSQIAVAATPQLEVPTPVLPTPTSVESSVLLPEPTQPPAQATAEGGISSTRAKVQELAELKKSGNSLFDELITPFANEAEKRRAELAKSDPDYHKRVDPELNANRVNFLLFGYGESHEPPATERALIGSQTIISYNLLDRTADIVSLTHDIRAPEIERQIAQRGQKSPAVRIDQAYNVGGFKLMRQVLENATGLSIDFQVTFKDAVLQRLIDDVFGGVQVDVPMAFEVQPFYLDGVKYPKGSFPPGPQKLTGRQVVQFIKTVPIAAGAYDKSLEHNARKHLIFAALLQAIDDNYRDGSFWLKGSALVTKELVTGAVTYDFDPVPLVINNVGTTASNIRKLGKNRADGIQAPQIEKSIYVVDPACGDGGVQWVNANAAVNPLTKKDIEAGVYSSLDMEIPIDANPYGDLASQYWTSVRALVKNTLLGTAGQSGTKQP